MPSRRSPRVPMLAKRAWTVQCQRCFPFIGIEARCLWNSIKPRCPPKPSLMSLSLLFHEHSLQTLGILDVHGLNIAVELLLGVLLVVSSPRDADPESIRITLDTALPDLLVQLGIQTDGGSALIPFG